MRSIVIGAGKMGFSIAKLLSNENHDVVLIDNNEERIRIIDDVLDVQVIAGTGSSWRVLESAGVRNADMVVAVTEIDELNMIACFLAKQYGVKTTIARVRDTEYVEQPHFSIANLLGIDLIINPEMVTAFEIFNIIKNPEAVNVDYYSDNKVLLAEFIIRNDSPIVNNQLKQLDASKFVILSIVHDNHMIVPSGDDIIRGGDHVYIITKTEDISAVLKSLGIIRKKIEHVTILGAGRTGYYLAKILENEMKNVSIKVIEKNPLRAREVSNMLSRSMVIKGDGADLDLLTAENIGQSDIYVAVTDDDKLNLLSSLIAKNIGVKKTIAKVKREDILPLMEEIGIDAVLSPRVLAAGYILKYIRQGDIVSVTVLGNENAEMIEFNAQSGSVVVKKQLMHIRFPAGSVVGAIVRNGEVYIPSGDFEILANDKVMVFALPASIHKIEKLFSSRLKKW